MAKTILHPANKRGVYAFVLSVDVTIHQQALHTRDGFGIWETDRFEIRAETPVQLLIMEVPMTISHFD